MRLIIAAFGLELDLTTERIEPGPTDRWLGFTGGWEA